MQLSVRCSDQSWLAKGIFPAQPALSPAEDAPVRWHRHRHLTRPRKRIQSRVTPSCTPMAATRWTTACPERHWRPVVPLPVCQESPSSRPRTNSDLRKHGPLSRKVGDASCAPPGEGSHWCPETRDSDAQAVGLPSRMGRRNDTLLPAEATPFKALDAAF